MWRQMSRQIDHLSTGKSDYQVNSNVSVVENDSIEMPSGLVGRFNQTALKYSKKMAVSDDQSTLTYGQLYDKTNQLAQFLLFHKIQKRKKIGILAQRSSSFIVGILGILKAGAAYVPYDPEHPLERIAMMLDLSKVETLLVDASSASLLKKLSEYQSFVKKVVFLEPLPKDFSIRELSWNIYDADEWQSASKENPQIESKGENSLVILFTSGSTGKPKGVELSHKGYINNFENMQRLINFNKNSKVAQMASPCFDISVTELWMPLLFGACIFIASNQTKKNPWALSEWIKRYQIDIIQFVPSLFQVFVFALQKEGISFPSIKKLLFIGEPLRSQLISQWYQSSENLECKIYNLYGPVETSIEVSAFIIDRHSSLDWNYVPIGKPFKNMQFYLQNDEKQSSEEGVLFLEGVQLAKGYLNSDRKIDAFQNGLYRSGDIVRRMPSGDFMFLMREDRQVKIRGNRVELGEIETILNNHAEINHAAVKAVRNSEDIKIQAFVVSSSLSKQAILEFLKQKLPHYMIPHETYILNTIPLNSNGKIDYNALHSRRR